MRAFIAAAIAGALVSGAALAANAPLVAPNGTPWLGVRAKALDQLQTYDCGAAKCAPATPAERAHPPLSDSEAQWIYQRGVYSGVAAHCGLDWRSRNYTPVMAHLQTTERKSTRELALASGVHDIARDMAKAALGRVGACSPELKADMDRRLDFRPPSAR